MAVERREESGPADADRGFWQRVATVTEGSIEPPADGWQKIARRIELEEQRSEPAATAAPTGAGLRLPGALVWGLGLFALVVLAVVTANTRPAPIETVAPELLPIHPAPVDLHTRQMKIDYEGAISVGLKESHLRLDFRITNTGTGPIEIPGPGGPTSASPHYLLDVRQNGEAVEQLHLVAESADLRLINGTMPAVGDPSLDVTLAPGEWLIAHVNGEVARLFPRGPGLYQVRVHFLPPSLSEKSSPPDTFSPPAEVRVGK